MFELIGMVFVGFIIWSVVRGLAIGATNNTTRRAIEFAVSNDVPRRFAREMMRSPGNMRQAVEIMQRGDPDFAMKDVYQQYGLALVMVHQGVINNWGEETS